MKINKSKNSLKSKNGITLIALVITIIVLLILAGVSISLVVGNRNVTLANSGTGASTGGTGGGSSGSGSGSSSGTEAGTAISDSTHYGDYFDLGTEILGTVTNGAYSSTKTLEGETTAIKADWRIFSKDSTGVWLILADYLPINGSTINTLITGTGTNQIGLVTKTGDDLSSYPYSVWSNTSRSDLITRLTSNWKGLLPSTLQSDTDITAVGALTVSEWQESWNSKYSSNTITITGDETNGYSYKGLSLETGYSNTLYFPHKSTQSNCEGYWLASPNASCTDAVIYVDYYGCVFNSDYSDSRGVRPAVHLASAINIEQDSTTGIWSISD